MSEKTAAAPAQLMLPYEPLVKLATRQNIRDVAGITQMKDDYKVPYVTIALRDEYNNRIRWQWMDDEAWEKHLGIVELAKGLLASRNGPPKLYGDFVIENDVVLFILTDGERRWRAIGYILRNVATFFPDLKEGEEPTWQDGTPIKMVKVEPNPPKFTEWDRLHQQHATNNNKKYSVLENAQICYRKKNFFLKNKEDEKVILAKHEIPEDKLSLYIPVSNDDIAHDMNMSRQWVDDMVAIHDLPEELRKEINNGKPYSNVLRAYRAEQKEKAGKLPVATIVKNEGGEVIGTVTGNGQVQLDQPLNPEKEERDDDEVDNDIPINQEIRTAQPFTGNHTVVDTKAADKAEENSHKTSAAPQTAPPPKTTEDAILNDFKTEKELCDLDLNEVKKMLDSLSVKLGYLPNRIGVKGTKDECIGLIDKLILPKVIAVQERIRKAPIRGTD